MLRRISASRLFVTLRAGQFLHQGVSRVVERLGRIRPVKQHATQAGEHAGQAQLLVEHIIEHVVMAAKAIMTLECLNTQQVHGQDLADHRLMRGADVVASSGL